LPAYDAILLAGGAGRRLGRRDKAALVLGGRPLGARVRAAAAGASRVVVVGPDRPWLTADVVTREEPPGAGPLAAIGAGIAHVTRPTVVVVAVDLPFLEGAHLDLLRLALVADAAADVALAVDDAGQDQPLMSAWRADRLRAQLAALGPLADRPVRSLLIRARPVRVALARSVQVPPPWFDCDTEEDLREAERWI
jgi:molybdopterin-guanine dinucleotide biosynthesis protein A